MGQVYRAHDSKLNREEPVAQLPEAIKYTRRADGALETAISGAANQRS